MRGINASPRAMDFKLTRGYHQLKFLNSCKINSKSSLSCSELIFPISNTKTWKRFLRDVHWPRVFKLSFYIFKNFFCFFSAFWFIGASAELIDFFGFAAKFFAANTQRGVIT
jgi:hypothetical protein